MLRAFLRTASSQSRSHEYERVARIGLHTEVDCRIFLLVRTHPFRVGRCASYERVPRAKCRAPLLGHSADTEDDSSADKSGSGAHGEFEHALQRRGCAVRKVATGANV